MIKELIKKYGLEEIVYDTETYYTWEIDGAIRYGSAIRVENSRFGKFKIYAATEINLFKTPSGYNLQYVNWQQIELKDLEERLKLLKYAYNRELLRYKKYIMEDKMENIEKDF